MANIQLKPGGDAVSTRTDPTASIVADPKIFPPGKYTFALVVSDDAGMSSDAATLVVEVRNKPVAKITGTQVVAVGQPINLSGDGSTATGKITIYSWMVKG